MFTTRVPPSRDRYHRSKTRHQPLQIVLIFRAVTLTDMTHCPKVKNVYAALGRFDGATLMV